MKPAVLAVVIAAAASIPVFPQSPPAKPAGPQETARDPRALQIFSRGVKAQVPGGGTTAIKDFQADLEVTFHEWDEKERRSHARSGTVAEFYKVADDGRVLYRRDLFDTINDKRTIHGKTADLHWQKIGKAPAEELRGRDGQEQIKRIRDEIARIQEFLKLLLLSNLDGPTVSLRSLGRTTIKAAGNIVEVERILREKTGERPVELYFGVKDDRLHGLHRPASGGLAAETITFSHHAPLSTGGATILVPLVVEYRENGALTLEARAKDVSSIKVNSNIRPEVFAMPR